MATQSMIRGDTIPDLQATLTGEVGGVVTAAPLNTAQSILAIANQRGTVLFSRAVTGNASGVINMQWQTGDTLLTGPIFVDFQVTWTSGRIETFRSAVVVDVLPSLA